MPLFCHTQITVKNWWNLPISNPDPDLNNISFTYKKYTGSCFLEFPIGSL